MFYLAANVPGLSVRATHVSQREQDDDVAGSIQNEAGNILREGFRDQTRLHRSPLDDLLDQPSFKSFDPGDRTDPTK